MYGTLGAEVPGHRQEQLTKTIIVRLLKMHGFLHQSLILKSQQNSIELVTRPALAAVLRVRVGLRMEELEFSLPLPLRLTGPPSGLCGWTPQAWPS